MARFFRHGELPLVLLAILAQRPMHGYELMSELSRLFSTGGYRPSPGTVYPAVDALAAEGLLTGHTHEGRTVYSASEEGEQALGSRIDVLAGVELHDAGIQLGGERRHPGPLERRHRDDDVLGLERLIAGERRPPLCRAWPAGPCTMPRELDHNIGPDVLGALFERAGRLSV